MARVEEKISRWKKPDELAHAVMTQTPSEVAELYKSFGKVDFTARALGLACRYRGLDMVKVLIEGGAEFTYDLEKIKRLWNNNNRAAELDDGANYAVGLLGSVGIGVMNYFVFIGKQYNRKMLSFDDRLVILDYLCETANKTGFDKDELLFYAYFSGERKITDHLKENGAVVPETWIKIVTGGSWDDQSKERWFDYCFLMQRLSDNDFMPCMSELVSELGGRKLHFTEWLWTAGLAKRQNIPGFYKFLTESFDLSKVNKGKMMKSIIVRESMDGLAAVAELGWLKMPKKRDEMIAFAAEKGKTECTAWLLDFKNRTADFASERARAEKKAQRELNADPNSATELKKVWSWKNREDGTIVITGYKGDKTEITVPERIGKDTVTAIGEYAFSPEAKRIRAEQREVRKAIAVVILPDTITEIGDCAFLDCISLAHFEIPPKISEISKEMLRLTGISEIVICGSVKKIGWSALSRCFDLKTAVLCEGVEEIESAAFFSCCALKTIEIPRSVTKIASGKYDNPFFDDNKLTVMLYKGSYAEQYCVENKIPFKYKEEHTDGSC